MIWLDFKKKCLMVRMSHLHYCSSRFARILHLDVSWAICPLWVCCSLEPILIRPSSLQLKPNTCRVHHSQCSPYLTCSPHVTLWTCSLRKRCPLDLQASPLVFLPQGQFPLNHSVGSSRWPVYVGGPSPSCLGDLTVLASDVMRYIFPADILHFTPLPFYKT